MCKHSKSLWVMTFFLAAALAFEGGGPAGAAPNPVDKDGPPVVKKQGASLADVLGRVKMAASGEEWKKEEWTDPLIELWLADVIKAVRAAGLGKELPEPVAFADYGRREPLVRPGANPHAPPRPGEGALVVTQRLDVPHLRHTIALVDGDATVGFANDCVIVARGSVTVSHGSGNIIVAGRFIHVSHDGSERSSAARRREMEAMAAARGRPLPERPVPPPGAQRRVPPMSLLVSGGVLDIAHAGGTVCVGLQRVEISHALECVFVNSPNVETSHRTGCAEVMLDKALIGAPPAPHPLEAELRLHSATNHTVIFFFKGRRYVGEKGKPIDDEAGQLVAELAGWTLSAAESGYAVLSNDKERASILLERRAQR